MKDFNTLPAKKQDKKLLELWAKLVKLRAHNKCEYPNCTKVNKLDAHHIYGRTNYNCRYDLDNGVCLCSGHHTFRKDSAHNAPLDFLEKLITKRGSAWFVRLRKKAMKDNIKPDKSLIYKELKELEEKYDGE